MRLYQRQIDLENEYSTKSLADGQRLVNEALAQGRVTNIGQGRIVLAKAFEVAVEAFNTDMAVPSKGLHGKYRTLLKKADADVVVMAGLRDIINACANFEPVAMQTILRNIGKTIEAEVLLKCMTTISPEYTAKTEQYLDTVGTKSFSHRNRTFLKGAEALRLDWNSWTDAERIGVANLLITSLYESTGLFKWVQSEAVTKGTSMYFVAPSDHLAKVFDEVQSAARAVVKYPPMVCKPDHWDSQWSGGYVTEWFKNHAPMCGLRYIKQQHRRWILEGLASNAASTVRTAMNKAQSVPYRVNKEVLDVLRRATAMRVGIMGLPSFQEAPKPVFPFSDGWDKLEASEQDLEQFKFWKSQMAAWYTKEVKRKGRQMGILGRINELVRYKDEPELYFPTFIDWRGRLYFRSNLNPQAVDAVKGCLEFAEGKPLGEVGLFWLKVHVANSCGYDKHTPEVKAKWCEDNWSQISDFINNPLDVDSPEPDTAFTLLQAGIALQEALSMDEPTEYICRVPVAMDATCSGLQHLSALTRDTEGAYHTNLINNGTDKKSDIYMHVAKLATEMLPKFVPDTAVSQFWEQNEITRNMSKKPVMTHVYGATLLNCIDELALQLSDAGHEPIKEGDKVLYSMTALAVPTGKALKHGVVKAVPKADRMMKYLQKVVRTNKVDCVCWTSPIGVPVVNWAEGNILKQIHIRSMGISAIVLNTGDGKYNTRIAANGIVPNFVHSFDASHLCMTITEAGCDILPIHDSFATHPCDVPELHAVLRTQFIKLYKDFNIEDMLKFNNVDLEELPVPPIGTLDLDTINDSPFMFG